MALKALNTLTVKKKWEVERERKASREQQEMERENGGNKLENYFVPVGTKGKAKMEEWKPTDAVLRDGDPNDADNDADNDLDMDEGVSKLKATNNALDAEPIKDAVIDGKFARKRNQAMRALNKMDLSPDDSNSTAKQSRHTKRKAQRRAEKKLAREESKLANYFGDDAKRASGANGIPQQRVIAKRGRSLSMDNGDGAFESGITKRYREGTPAADASIPSLKNESSIVGEPVAQDSRSQLMQEDDRSGGSVMKDEDLPNYSGNGKRRKNSKQIKQPQPTHPNACPSCTSLSHFKKECPERSMKGNCRFCGKYNYPKSQCPLLNNRSIFAFASIFRFDYSLPRQILGFPAPHTYDGLTVYVRPVACEKDLLEVLMGFEAHVRDTFRILEGGTDWRVSWKVEFTDRLKAGEFVEKFGGVERWQRGHIVAGWAC
ncbi:hypothetical protein EJ08DRAFT_146401 [Tothia fuscella]|uniref:Uncharacterized protein n=1 Tax=Tothia fuscella TaxID=1048955 RepID=A0A9P4P1D9_9PEZI|nr:hypothetical protein EJ08DRAFT_146401 [Tothia fuscella]